MFNKIFVDMIIEAINSSDMYPDEYTRKLDIASLHLIVEKFDLEFFSCTHEYDEQEYKKFYMKTVKKYDKKSHNEIMREFKRITTDS
ncbi:MAG: hypothetical protein GQ570_05595 [Helicobacteraceae bacterium]|nr:hypothetical protein [Helicobacteraceae bacterium]